MLDSTTNSDVYKHYAGAICLNNDLIIRGAFNQVNISESKDGYVLSIESGVIDTDLLNQMTQLSPLPGKMMRLNESTLTLTLVYKVSNKAQLPQSVIKASEGKEIKEWSIVGAKPKTLVTSDPLSPSVSRLYLITLTAPSISINTNTSEFLKYKEPDSPLYNRENSTYSIYGPLV